MENGGCSYMLSSLSVHNRTRLTWLYVEDVDQAYRQIILDEGKPLSQPRNEPHGCREFLVEDPDGEIYVISQVIEKST